MWRTVASGKPQIRFFLLLFDAINCTPTWPSRHPKRMRWSKQHTFRIRELISVPFIHTHPTIQQTMWKRNTYQFSLGTSVWSHNPVPIAAMALQYRANQDPANASSLRDDETPTRAHSGRSVCERSPKERRWFSEEILSSLDWQPHLLEEYLQNIDFNIISTVSLCSVFYHFRKSNKKSLIKEIKKKLFAKKHYEK